MSKISESVIAYHNTKEKFDTFDDKFIGYGHGVNYANGFYFASSPVNEYGNTIKVELDIENPYVFDYNSNKEVEDFLHECGVDELGYFTDDVDDRDRKWSISKELREFYDDDYLTKVTNVLKQKGYDSVIIKNAPVGMGNTKQILDKEYVVFDADNIKIIDKDNINESYMRLDEATRNQLINKTKNSDNYKDTSKGKNRYERRTKSRIATSVAQYNKVDMDALFKRDILTLGVDVHGETNDYVVTVRFIGFLKELQRQVKANNNKLEFKSIVRAMSSTFNSGDVSLHCTCPDFCLKEDTKIKLLNGSILTVKEMFEQFSKNKEMWVYSTDDKGDFRPGKVNDVWISGYVNDMIKITLDNGNVIETTPNHRYMLRSGEYVEAKDLEVGSSLMPLYFREYEGYENVKLNSKAHTQYNSIYKIVADECKQQEIEEAKIRSGEDIIAIHHSDFNKLNNYPSNLVPMGKLEHWNYHNTHLIESGNFDKFIEGGKKYWSTQEARDRQAEVMRETINDYYANVSKEELKRIRETYYGDEWKQKISEGNKKVWENYSEEEYKARCQLNKENNAKSKEKRVLAVSESWKNLSDEDRKTRSKNISNGNKNTWREHPEKHLTEKFIQARKNAFKFVRDEEMIKKINISKIGNVLNRILDANEIPSPETYKKYKANGYPNWTKSFNTWEELSNYYQINHKVVNIEFIHYDKEIPVYDISVEKYNNFYVDAGVVLHNCYRQSYYASKNNYGTQYEPRPSNITNPNDTKGGGCKHCMLVLANLDWIMKVSSVINNYIKYCQNNMEYNYANYIFPKIYGMPYKNAIQMSLIDTGGYLPSDQKTVGDIAKRNLGDKDEKGKFVKGNKFTFDKHPDKRVQWTSDKVKPVNNTPTPLELAAQQEEPTFEKEQNPDGGFRI